MTSHLHNISIVNALVAWTAVYWLLRPRLARAPFDTRLATSLAPHLFRYLGLIAFVPTLFDMRALGFSDAYQSIVAWGDFASGLLALFAIGLVHTRHPLAIPTVWVFNVVGMLDFCYAGLQLAPRITDSTIIGPLAWPVFTLYLPMLVVSHVAIFVLLWGGRRTVALTFTRG
jgi:hypothetical protein